MPSTWNVRRPKPSLEALARDVGDARAEVAAALEGDGENSRPHREAKAELAAAERRLESARWAEEKRERSDALTPEQIVAKAREL